MGNCLVLEEKVIEIMKTDGETLRHQSPLKAQQVLNMFPGHAISETLPRITYSDPTMSMRHGRLCRRLPPEKQPAKTGADEDGFIRIKMVITKQQFRDMLRKGGVSPDGMLRSPSGATGEKTRSMEWRPTLQSIPEGDDLCLE
ncbi:uncharacterized protein LOC122019016 [Zingiber officinale]|uniref:Uncharacterized protein n=1 Tax=Zingiber officinale TaxID=94328 RepID=A0A8J5F4I4_ZINOF|nr:uncharacterized protein LOC122019016 [Zingiber officinale]KAG6478148.1 hypothetical protein ZIOFF_061580 [Zingiber officinale]